MKKVDQVKIGCKQGCEQRVVGQEEERNQGREEDSNQGERSREEGEERLK